MHVREFELALDAYQKCLQLARASSDRGAECEALCCIGGAHIPLGNMHKALLFSGKALVVAREIRDRRAEGRSLANLGIAHLGLGENKRVIQCHSESLNISRELGDRRVCVPSWWKMCCVTLAAFCSAD